MIINKGKFDVVSSFQEDPFVGHLATPITTSNLTKTYLNLLPAYKKGLSPLLRGINIGFVHGYFLLGPFTKLGPLRDSQVSSFVGYLATIGLILILTSALLIYGFVTFSSTDETNVGMVVLGQVPKNVNQSPSNVDFLNKKGWSQFTAGFILGGFGGVSIAYALLKII